MNIDNEIDNYFYGDFSGYERKEKEGLCVLMNRVWVRVMDWKKDPKTMNAAALRKIARHFYELGKKDASVNITGEDILNAGNAYIESLKPKM